VVATGRVNLGDLEVWASLAAGDGSAWAGTMGLVVGKVINWRADNVLPSNTGIISTVR
jgi:hypothetical protein